MYYKHFHESLAPHLVNVFNNAITAGHFQKEMLQAVVTIIPKPDKDLTMPSNYRPVSLLNSDIKIYAKAIALRLLDILPPLIDPNQVSFSKDRQAPDTTRHMLNILRFVEIHKTPARFLLLDAEKTFDQYLGIP